MQIGMVWSIGKKYFGYLRAQRKLQRIKFNSKLIINSKRSRYENRTYISLDQ